MHMYCIRICAYTNTRICVYQYAYTRVGLTRIMHIFWFGYIWAALYVYCCEDELINMAQVWDKEISQSPTGIKPMTSRTYGRHSIHWATRTHGEQGHLAEFKWANQSFVHIMACTKYQVEKIKYMYYRSLKIT